MCERGDQAFVVLPGPDSDAQMAGCQTLEAGAIPDENLVFPGEPFNDFVRVRQFFP